MPGRNFLVALRALREQQLRATLAILGMAIGVGSVSLLLAIGQGVQTDVAREIDSLGADCAFVVPGRLDRSGRPNPMSTLGISTLTTSDLGALAGVPGITTVVPLMFVFGSAENGAVSTSAIVIAVDARYRSFRHDAVSQGRFYTLAEDSEPVCVISAGPAAELFPGRSAIGEFLTVRGSRFRVVGVLRELEDPTLGLMPFGDMVYLPQNAARRAFGGGQVNRILVKADRSRDPEQTMDAARAALQRNHGGRDDFGVLTSRQLLGVVYRIFNVLTALLSGVGAISLVVAGIGIMNVMLISVSERTREIGIRKASGARNVDLFEQFLVESVGLSLVGGAVGLAMAVSASWAVTRWSPLRPEFAGTGIALAMGVCAFVGVVFGVLPAVRASRLTPVDALRHE